MEPSVSLLDRGAYRQGCAFERGVPLRPRELALQRRIVVLEPCKQQTRLSQIGRVEAASERLVVNLLRLFQSVHLKAAHHPVPISPRSGQETCGLASLAERPIEITEVSEANGKVVASDQVVRVG